MFKKNNLFLNARVTLRDGSPMTVDDPHVVRSLIHQQLHTHQNRFALKKKQQKKNSGRRPKAQRPAHKQAVDFKQEMKKMGVVVHH